MAIQNISIGIVGSGGDGVMSAGELIVNAVAREGLNAVMLRSVGPQIRGGESSCKIRIGSHKVSAPADALDVLVALNWQDYTRFGSELVLKPGRTVIEEGEKGDPDIERPLIGPAPDHVLRVPFTRLSKEATGGTRSRNLVAIGVLSSMCNLPREATIKSIDKMFSSKGQEMVDSNAKAFELGWEYAEGNLDKIAEIELPTLDYHGDRVVMTGNDAIAYASVLAGCNFFAGYPITPSSEVMEFLSLHLPRFGGTVLQTEDEIAAIGAVLGASLAGAKAMTATSGPGLSLMTEMLGLASIAEIPCVIVDVQRVGPSTGIPTKSEQSDLYHAVFSGHGDFPRVVMAPADINDCFDVIREAFYVSEKYQIPVIILSDGFIGQRKSSIPPADTSKVRSYERVKPDPDSDEIYRRFKITDSGVSPMAVPGMKNVLYRSAGIEHDEFGNPTSDFDLHQEMSEKRFRKLEGIRKDVNFMRRYGPEKARIGIISWGSNKDGIREAVELLNQSGYEVAGLVPQVLYPLDTEKVQAFFDSVEQSIVIELSFAKQFLNVLKVQMDLPANVVHYGRVGVKPLGAGEIIHQVKALL